MGTDRVFPSRLIAAEAVAPSARDTPRRRLRIPTASPRTIRQHAAARPFARHVGDWRRSFVARNPSCALLSRPHANSHGRARSNHARKRQSACVARRCRVSPANGPNAVQIASRGREGTGARQARGACSSGAPFASRRHARVWAADRPEQASISRSRVASVGRHFQHRQRGTRLTPQRAASARRSRLRVAELRHPSRPHAVRPRR